MEDLLRAAGLTEKLIVEPEHGESLGEWMFRAFAEGDYASASCIDPRQVAQRCFYQCVDEYTDLQPDTLVRPLPVSAVSGVLFGSSVCS